MMPFQPTIADAELWDGDMTSSRLDDHDVLLVRHNGVVYAYENRCAHLGVALSEGRLDGHVLTCGAHHWQYDVRSGTGVNPGTACLRHFPVKIEDGKVFVDVQAPDPRFPNAEDAADYVGPVFTGHPHAQAVLEAIRRLNPSVEIHNRGSYVRVLAPRRCLVTRSAVEDILRQPFAFRAELEIMMPSFKGRMRLDDDEAVWTFEDGAISGATASPTGPRHPEITANFKDLARRDDGDTLEATATSGPKGRSPRKRGQKRTYWHLSDLGRKPTDYDIATSQLHYWTARGFEVKVPVTDWYERYQRGSELRCRDWEAWGDPRQTTYTTYTTMQRTREAFVNGLLDSISEDYDRGLSPQWVALLERILAPLRYPGHGLQMVAAYVGSMAPTARITIAATFQAADEMRRVQRLAYRMRQFQMTHPEFGSKARQTWQDDPIWQPLREVIETLLVTWDWGEALVALQLVLKPAFDELFMTQFGRLARASGDDVLERLFFSLNEDCAWHRSWSKSLLLTAVRDTPESSPAIQRWIEIWVPRVSRAIAAFHPVFDEMLPGGSAPFAPVLGEIEQFCQGYRDSILRTGDLQPGGSR
jgi:toluene monooxygenase system protein E